MDISNFLVIDRHPGGCTGTVSIGLIGDASETWTLVTDSIHYTTEDIRGSGVFDEVYTTFHAQNPRLRMMPWDITQDKDAPQLYTVTLKWTSDKVEPPDEEDDPLDRKAKITVETQFAKETRHRDFYGKPKVNAAGDLFDPPIENNVAIRVIKIRKNVTAFPDWVFDYADAINSLTFSIKGRPFPPGSVWLSYVKLGEIDETGDVPFCEATIEMHVKKRRNPGVGEDVDDVPWAWRTEQLNEGLHALDEETAEKYRIKVKDPESDAMVFAASPVPLTADGDILTPVTIDNANFIVFRDHPELDFNLISYLWSDA